MWLETTTYIETACVHSCADAQCWAAQPANRTGMTLKWIRGAWLPRSAIATRAVIVCGDGDVRGAGVNIGQVQRKILVLVGHSKSTATRRPHDTPATLNPTARTRWIDVSQHSQSNLKRNWCRAASRIETKKTWVRLTTKSLIQEKVVTLKRHPSCWGLCGFTFKIILQLMVKRFFGLCSNWTACFYYDLSGRKT